jgi:hypothetical protein
MSHGANLPSSPRAKAHRDTRKCRQRLLLSSTTAALDSARPMIGVAAGGSAPMMKEAMAKTNTAGNRDRKIMISPLACPHQQPTDLAGKRVG